MPGLYFGDDSNRKDVASRFVNDVSSKNDSKAGEPAPVSQSPVPSSSRNLSHASNRDDPSDGFKNDFSSRATVEARKLQEAFDLRSKRAAEDAATAAAKKAEEEAQDLERLRELKSTHEVQIKDLTEQLEKATSDVAGLQSTKTRLEVDNTDLNGKLDSEKEKSKRARQEASGYYSRINDQMMQLQAKRDLDANNNLDPACHGKPAYIVHLRSRTAVDLGAGESSLPVAHAAVASSPCTHNCQVRELIVTAGASISPMVTRRYCCTKSTLITASQTGLLWSIIAIWNFCMTATATSLAVTAEGLAVLQQCKNGKLGESALVAMCKSKLI